MNIFRNIITLIILLLVTSELAMSQPNDDKKKIKAEIDKIMKAKLIDSLGMDESTADKFLNLSRENNKQIRSLSKEKRELMKSIELDPGASDIDSKFDKMLELETNILDKRKSFFQDLKTFLTPQQIAKVLILRKKLGREMRKEIMKHKKTDKIEEKNE